jgi:glutathione peroxidase
LSPPVGTCIKYPNPPEKPEWSPTMSRSLYDIPLSRIDGRPTSLAEFRGKVLLVVNVASKCGLTPQYAGLQQLYQAKQPEGLEILGFPANDFGGQEPGTEAEIAEFCSTTYNVEFPLFQKISVVGADRHPLYDALVKAQPEAEDAEPMRARLAGYGIKPASETDVLWNFEKFLVSRDGEIVGRFAPSITADDPRLSAAIEDALHKPA